MKPQNNKQKNSVQPAQQKVKYPENITIYRNPILTIEILTILLIGFLKSSILFIKKHIIPIVICITLILSFSYAPGPHEAVILIILSFNIIQYRETTKEILTFALWWVGLGVASSIGLGTGLHTFVLYLGPYMAKVTMAANECNYVPQQLPNKWNF